MTENYNSILSTLCWHRLSAELVNIRLLPSASAHPVTVIQAIIKGTTDLLGKPEEPLIFFHIKNRRHTFKLRESERLKIEVFFFQKGLGYVQQCQEALKAYLADPKTGKNFEIIETAAIEERSYNLIASFIGKISGEGEICLEFLTPFPFNREKEKHRTYITKEAFVKSFEKRFSRLFGKNITYQSNEDNFSLLPYYWNYTEIKHASYSQPGNIQYINGCVGNLYIKGRFSNLLPFLLLGSELHTGSKLSNSQGYYILHKESQGYFQTYFPDKKGVITLIRDVLERYDSALESLSKTEGFPFNEESFADEILKEITTDTYIPTPSTAFFIKKKSGLDRIVEQPGFKDLIIQQYILKTIAKPFDRILEQGSIGFRKGISRTKAVEIVKEAIKEGHQYIIEGDIEDFFPSVDLSLLDELLDFYIPKKDTLLNNLLKKSIKNGYVLDGAYRERTKGLAQGSPLSPILANIYLDSFDELVMQWKVKMIRYADDLIIMTRTKEEAENILSKTEAFLSRIGLKLKKEKTSIKQIKEGFRFLGMRFERDEVVIEPEEQYNRQLKKP